MENSFIYFPSFLDKIYCVFFGFFSVLDFILCFFFLNLILCRGSNNFLSRKLLTTFIFFVFIFLVFGWEKEKTHLFIIKSHFKF